MSAHSHNVPANKPSCPHCTSPSTHLTGIPSVGVRVVTFRVGVPMDSASHWEGNIQVTEARYRMLGSVSIGVCQRCIWKWRGAFLAFAFTAGPVLGALAISCVAYLHWIETGDPASWFPLSPKESREATQLERLSLAGGFLILFLLATASLLGPVFAVVFNQVPIWVARRRSSSFIKSKFGRCELFDERLWPNGTLSYPGEIL